MSEPPRPQPVACQAGLTLEEATQPPGKCGSRGHSEPDSGSPLRSTGPSNALRTGCSVSALHLEGHSPQQPAEIH